MDKETVNSLVSEAQHIAENAGNLIMTFFDELAEEEVEYKADQSPVTLADKAANKQIVDELINLDFGNSGEYTTFTAQYTAPIGGQSILKIKAKEFRFDIKNIQVENLGVEEPDEEVFDESGSTSVPYLRVCLCDGTTSTNGGFKKDIEYWLNNSETDYGYDSSGLDDGDSTIGFDATYDFNDEIPESMYPSNCIGFDYARSLVEQRYPEIDTANPDAFGIFLSLIHI